MYGSTTLPGGTNTQYQLINITNNKNYLWMEFPGHWGVIKDYLVSPDRLIDSRLINSGPVSPPYKAIWNHIFE